ncbi:HesB/IscA family protein [Rickettsiales endosymbiont of Trichoplax sp. H2]|uniref:HesB/IscA family protein n=1 Tax=Rickettsiales endosymbiont of Trichoplax sp. H2 TaxID=2021221 RepID=UPI0012B305AE|nr:iron-sulfur cluster assembly accessory protein [Rickettsiales endosymbiont of Trichoplax sp. H2]MSO13485.1 Iron-sulfur cluster insertion protein ErpA [Rickettsiales endosymbiont of Trichoplax sp. H2]
MNEFSISQKAADKINMLNSKESKPQMFRIKVEGGGCNGLKYQIGFTDSKNNDDFEYDKDGACVVIDKISIEFLKNSELEYVEELGNSSFVINNPNSKSSCGCGSSFSF